MAQEDSSRDIDRAAADWAARLDRGLLTEGETSELDAWLIADPRARGALLRAQAMSMLSESAAALGPDFDPREFGPSSSRRVVHGMSRRRLLGATGGAVGAASLMAFGFGVSSAGAVSRTARGEIRLVPLKDGSTVLLNTLSAVRIRYDDHERKATLLEGEAYFSVAHDARPFVLDVEGRRLHATRASFRVRKLGGQPIDVLVNEGQVRLLPHAAAPQPGQGELLGGNTRMRLASTEGRPAGQAERVAPETVTRELAWREGKLAFEGEPLHHAAATFARYSNTQIRIADADLARQPVTGLFAANDPVGFSRAVARVFDAQLQVGEKQVVLARSASPG